MDLVRYAETKGFESDYTMPYVSRYRDYLIRAFNGDIPYDQFVREAIAGDLLPTPRRNMTGESIESVVGPGFLYSNDGHHGPPDIHGEETRVFENLIDVTSKTFLALTIASARCHDHKFDAITTEDYYSMYGILASSRFHYANTIAPEVLHAHRPGLSSKKLKIKSIRTLIPIRDASIASVHKGQHFGMLAFGKVTSVSQCPIREFSWALFHNHDCRTHG